MTDTQSPAHSRRDKLGVKQLHLKTAKGKDVISRLQGLFPSSPRSTLSSTPISSTAPTLPSIDALMERPKREPKFLKVRIITWNMHDSLPKGDLEVLMGHVPPYAASKPPTDVSTIPTLALDGTHPYHLVVVAGQECPTQSGLPMGFGAGFKLIDSKDKDREKEHEKSAKLRKNADEYYQHDTPPSGWTQMVEDWLCHGACTNLDLPDSPASSGGNDSSPKQATHAQAESQRATRAKEPKKGPYQLLVKERMMGIYMAVYINRDIRSLVRGTSKSAVTAGLIGGRVGNKGGVGISVNVNGTTMLFLNAHLAAHEGKIHHRLANLAKIKAELAVDDFLSHDDSRVMSEDLTDKFDHTFLFGDLNFRLDISRLHADWLISRQDYAQALAFDQLLNLMRNGQAFVGFKEAPIDFPPTFKYDVLRTLKVKKPKRHGSKLGPWKLGPEKQRSLTEVEEQELEDGDDDDDEGEEGGIGEAASYASSVWTSVHSKHVPGDMEEDDYFHAPSSKGANASGSKITLAAVTAASKAKSKWLSIMTPTPSEPSSPTQWARSRSRQSEGQRSKEGRSSFSVDTLADGLPERPSLEGSRKTSRYLEVKHAGSSRSGAESDNENDDEDGDRGVYDSSAKKRVPSWCDRILWKTTVEPDPDPDYDDDMMDTQSRTRSRVGQFFANAFRRSRRESYESTVSTDIASFISDTPSTTLLESPGSELPFSRFASTSSSTPGLRISRSQDHLQSPPLTGFPRVNSLDAPTIPHRRTHSAVPPISTTNLRVSGLPRSGSVTDIGRSPAGSATPKETPQLASASRWRFFPSFLSHREPSAQSLAAPTIASSGPTSPEYRKGDVVCLSYDTLDDRAMRRLEGRSDHRPVVGSFAICISH